MDPERKEAKKTIPIELSMIILMHACTHIIRARQHSVTNIKPTHFKVIEVNRIDRNGQFLNKGQ